MDPKSSRRRAQRTDSKTADIFRMLEPILPLASNFKRRRCHGVRFTGTYCTDQDNKVPGVDATKNTFEPNPRHKSIEILRKYLAFQWDVTKRPPEVVTLEHKCTAAPQYDAMHPGVPREGY